jgi:WD40 repeat protein
MIGCLKGHKYGIEALIFSPNLEYLVSLGDRNDKGLFIWDWRKQTRLTSNGLKVYAKSIAF